MTLYHFSGAGNHFVVLDGREADMSAFRKTDHIIDLCRLWHTDGLMILEAGGIDFRMEFYNPDGSGGMMCGNGGRCIAAFASWLGIEPANGQEYVFMAPDGVHTAEILAHEAPQQWTVKLRMKDVCGIEPVLGGWFLDTGTRHHVRFVPDIEAIDIDTEGPRYRHDPAFAPIGANVNFVERRADGLHVRTFEKGVEGETLACGTGITASALAAWHAEGTKFDAGKPVHTPVRARQDWLSVDFTPLSETSFTDVYLTGPATLLETKEL